MHRVRITPAALRFAGLSAAVLAALFAANAVRATDMYKWTDEKGITHYSDTPPPQGESAAQRVKIETTEAPHLPVGATPAAADNKPATPANNAAEEQRKRACDQAQLTLDTLKSTKGPIADASSGKPLDDTERANRAALSERAVSVYCNPPAG